MKTDEFGDEVYYINKEFEQSCLRAMYVRGAARARTINQSVALQQLRKLVGLEPKTTFESSRYFKGTITLSLLLICIFTSC